MKTPTLHASSDRGVLLLERAGKNPIYRRDRQRRDDAHEAYSKMQ
jgi:hypothetical protein